MIYLDWIIAFIKIGVLILPALVGPFANYWKERKLKRKTVIRALEKHEQVSELIDSVYTTLYPTPIIIAAFIVVILYVFMVFLISTTIVGTVQSTIFTPITLLDPRVPILITTFNFTPLIIFMIFILVLGICNWKKCLEKY